MAMLYYRKSYQILKDHFGEKDHMTLHVYHRMYEFDYIYKK